MIYFTSYANHKFNLLNEHQVFIRKEQVEQTLRTPEQRGKINKYYTAEKDGLKVIYEKESGTINVITFYPTKN